MTKVRETILLLLAVLRIYIAEMRFLKYFRIVLISDNKLFIGLNKMLDEMIHLLTLELRQFRTCLGWISIAL